MTDRQTDDFSPSPFQTAPVRPRRSRWPWLLALVAFLLGLGAMFAAMPAIQRWRGGAAAQPAQPVAAAPAPSAPQVAATVPMTLEGLAARAAALDVQLDGIEARLAAADAASRTAAGNAARGEAMLVAVATRRAIDRGTPLGDLDGQLRQRFEAADAEAVANIIAAARAPVTREDLRLALDRIAPQLIGSSLDDGFLTAVGRSLSNLVVLRRASTPSPRASDRLERARRLVDAGNVEAALAEVARMPGAAGATSWIDAARRYVETRRALNRLELAALSGRAAPAAAPAPPPVVPVQPAPAAPNPAGQYPGA